MVKVAIPKVGFTLMLLIVGLRFGWGVGVGVGVGVGAVLLLPPQADRTNSAATTSNRRKGTSKVMGWKMLPQRSSRLPSYTPGFIVRMFGGRSGSRGRLPFPVQLRARPSGDCRSR